MVKQDSNDKRPGPTVKEVFDSLPDISVPEFDWIFEEIERFRREPIMSSYHPWEP